MNNQADASYIELNTPFEFEGISISAVVTQMDAAKLRGAVILAHGLGGEKNSETHLEIVPRLAKHGIASLRFDFPGHGESTGSTNDLTIKSGARLVNAVIDRTLDQFGQIPIAFIGASFGATAILQADTCTESIKAMVLRSPVSDYVGVRRRQLGEEGLNTWKEKGEITSLISRNRPSPYRFLEEAMMLDLFKRAKSQELALLIVQGSADKTVPLKDSRKLRSCWSGPCDLVTIEDGDHSLSNSRHTSLFCALGSEWISRYLFT